MVYWNRLEPNSADVDLEESVEARLADPLWMLARQWQLGEFKGEDAASPIHARAVVESYPIDTFRNGAVADAPIERFDPDRPLECRVEAEDVVDGPAAVALAAEAALQFLRRLDGAGLTHVRQAGGWQEGLRFDDQDAATERAHAHLPERTRLRLALLTRRAFDGRKLRALTPSRLRNLITRHVEEEVDAAALDAVLQAWRREYDARFDQPPSDGDCWVDERMEYRCSVGVRTASGEVVLEADEYHGGHLDWYAFRVSPAASHGLGGRRRRKREIELLPQPATFRGQGSSRWWEFEDRAVYFGNVSAGPADVARLVVAEFGTVFSDDWFMIPVRVDIGTLNRVTGVEVVDVFGETTMIASSAANDHERYGPSRPFRHFELEGDESAARGETPWLLVAPALTDAHNSRPVERVTLVRDEMANLGWAIEQTIELPTGEAMRRRRQWSRQRPEPGRPEDDDAELWRYRLQTPVAPWWVPLVPERTGDGAEVWLRRGRLQSWDELEPALVGAKGRLVGPARPFRLYEEEVPRGGAVVSRHWQRARGADGRIVTWMARRKRPGRGDRASGLEFDVIER